MNIYKVRAACNDFFIRAADVDEAISKFETWRDTPGSLVRPQDYAVTSAVVFLSPDAPHASTPANYID